MQERFSCFLGIGSNLGNRSENIKSALNNLAQVKGVKIEKVSCIRQTNPVGGPPQGKFLNAAVKIKTSLGPFRLLKVLKKIEKKLGRKNTVRFGPRVIDLDILFYDSKIINGKELVIPHPRMFARDFVLLSLREAI